jgi:hypothetical protein
MVWSLVEKPHRPRWGLATTIGMATILTFSETSDSLVISP